MNREKNLFDFNGSAAFIAGGASGLGKEIAVSLLNAGCKVFIGSRNEERNRLVAGELSSLTGGECIALPFDISSEVSVKDAMDKISNFTGGKLNIVINSAGFNIRNPIQEISLDEWNSVIGTNLTGAFLLSKYCFRLLKEAEFGRLINVTSIFSKVSFPDRVSYSSSKGGMIQMTKTLALEWAPYNITVNSISPGPFLTEINQAVLDNPENYKKFCERIPMKRFGSPEEISTTAIFLASKYSSYITGSDIVIDGGWTSA